MSRTGVRRRRIALAGTVAAICALGAGPLGRAIAPAETARPVAEHRYVVRAGDTLWSIATRVAPQEDPRAVVDSIETANGVDGASLVPGQSLVVPSGV